METFGTPSALAAVAKIARGRKRMLTLWLRGLEWLVRRLLFIEAHALKLAPTKRNFSTPKAWRDRCGRGGFACEDSSRWEVSFRVAMPARRRRYRRRNRKPPVPRAFSLAPLAERLEALSRVLADPAPYVRRLSRRLRRGLIVRRVVHRPPRGTPYRFFYAMDPFKAQLQAALDTPCDSS